jgi:UDPglucose--hexose-1-phosphate uridylyltransferase
VSEQVGLTRAGKIVTVLADGRELIYFDDAGSVVDHGDLVDHRQLEDAGHASILRFDRSVGEWVTIAGHRQTRTYLPPENECPLCPSTAEHLSEIPAPDYDVVVFENRFPSFTAPPSAPPIPTPQQPVQTAAALDGATEDSDPFGYPVEAPGSGRCEVVCFTSDHDAAFSSLTPRRVETVIEAWIDRTQFLSSLPYVAQVFCFENRGEEIGVTLSHPHGQIYGYPFVTPRTQRMLEAARQYHDQHRGNLFADIVASELAIGERVVTRSRHWVAFVPFAARWPMEVHVYPNRQVPDLPALTAEERADLAVIYLEVLQRMEGVHDDSLPYIAAWYQAPVSTGRDLAYLHLEICSIRRAPGKLKYLAGSEAAMGAFINDVAPEEAARRLREVTVSTPRNPA